MTFGHGSPFVKLMVTMRLEFFYSLNLWFVIWNFHAMLFKKGISSFADVLFPLFCAVCKKEGQWICESCMGALGNGIFLCVGCGTKSPQGRTCEACAPFFVLRAVAGLGSYASPSLRELIHAVKYLGARAVADGLAIFFARSTVLPWMREEGRAFAVVPVPLHARRLRFRGFNQAGALGRALAGELGLPFVEPIARARTTRFQVHQLSRVSRWNNVASAFVARGSVPENILLVDDVCTSGATLEVCARALRSRGAKEIRAAVIARG